MAGGRHGYSFEVFFFTPLERHGLVRLVTPPEKVLFLLPYKFIYALDFKCSTVLLLLLLVLFPNRKCDIMAATAFLDRKDGNSHLSSATNLQLGNNFYAMKF